MSKGIFKNCDIYTPICQPSDYKEKFAHLGACYLKVYHLGLESFKTHLNDTIDFKGLNNRISNDVRTLKSFGSSKDSTSKDSLSPKTPPLIHALHFMRHVMKVEKQLIESGADLIAKNEFMQILLTRKIALCIKKPTNYRSRG